MQKTFTRLRLIFLGLFILGAGASWIYQILWLGPERECLERGAWWSNRTRICAVPVDITDITGRPIGAPPVVQAAPATTAPAAQAAPAPR